MKLLITGPFPPYRGGIAHFNERMAYYLHDRGHEVIAMNFRFQYPRILFPGAKQTEEISDKVPYASHRIIHSINPLNWYTTARKIKAIAPDAVIFRYWLPFMAPALGSIAGMAGKKALRIGIMDNVIPHEKRLGDTVLTRFFMHNMDGFITLSEAVMQDLRKFDSHKPGKVLFHPVYDQFGEQVSMHAARETLGLDHNDRILLFFGFIRSYKGLDLAIQALARSGSDLNVKLLVAGEFYENKQKYLDLIASLGLGKRIILHDNFIPAEKVGAYFCAANAVIQPYKSATQSGVTQIAYHFERPMIVTNVSGLPEIVENRLSGLVVDIDQDSLGQAIRDFFTLNLEEELTRGVRQVKSRFSWHSFIVELEKFIREKASP